MGRQIFVTFDQLKHLSNVVLILLHPTKVQGLQIVIQNCLMDYPRPELTSNVNLTLVLFARTQKTLG